MKHVILIDAKNALFRFGSVHQFLSSSNGVKTGAIYGLLNCMLRLKKKYPDSRFMMVWDGPGENWRKREFPGYKSNRPVDKKPEILAVLEQIPLVKKITGALGIPQLEVRGVEADDLIGLMATRVLSPDRKPVIYSSDKDFLQLVGNSVIVIRDVDKSAKLAPEDEKSVYAKFGCAPKDVLKVRALCGDPSDAIPAVQKGIGIKTAAKMVEAGVDPSCPVPVHPCSAFAFFDKWELHSIWPAVRTNYRIMSIMTDTSDTHLAPKEKRILLDMLTREEANLYVAPNYSAKKYREFLSVLADLELSTVIENRHAFWHLQS